jgi:diacylglycerol kinase (ATP)
MRATVIVNPIAGPGRSATIGTCVDLVKSTLATHQCEADVRVTTGPNDAYRFATEAVAGKVDVVAAWGGDGTVNGAAAGVTGTGIPLAIIPGGSGNGLARDLSIPLRRRATSVRSMPAICTARCSSTWPASGWMRGLPDASPRKVTGAG